MQFWLDKLRSQTASLSSLKFLKTDFLGLTRCHPIFRTCSSSPWEVEKATTQARILSGRARLEGLTGHWVPGNKEGLCTLPDCWRTSAAHKGSVTDFLLSCPSLATTRESLQKFNKNFLQEYPNLSLLVDECLGDDPIQFWLDCSTMAPVIKTVQAQGESVLFLLFKMTRNFCHGLFKRRCDLLS